jgi:hypothetical protein
MLAWRVKGSARCVGQENAAFLGLTAALGRLALPE